MCPVSPYRLDMNINVKVVFVLADSILSHHTHKVTVIMHVSLSNCPNIKGD